MSKDYRVFRAFHRINKSRKKINRPTLKFNQFRAIMCTGADEKEVSRP